MHIIEFHSAPKAGASDSNEDVVFTNEHFIGIFDGSSLAKNERIEGMTGGRYAAMTLAQIASTLPWDVTPKRAVQTLTREFNAAMQRAAVREGIDPDKSLACATMVMYSRGRQEIWSVGDCTALVDGKRHHYPIRVAEMRAQLRQYMIHQEMEKGKTRSDLLDFDPTEDEIKNTVMKDSKVFANSDNPVFGYGVLNGKPVPENQIRVIPAANAKEIVLASDGYPKIFNTLAKTSAHLRRVVKQDPLCYTINPQPKAAHGKLYDDVSYVRFRPLG